MSVIMVSVVELLSVANVIKPFFFFLINAPGEEAKMFVPDMSLKPSPIFCGQGRGLPMWGTTGRLLALPANVRQG